MRWVSSNRPDHDGSTSSSRARGTHDLERSSTLPSTRRRRREPTRSAPASCSRSGARRASGRPSVWRRTASRRHAASEPARSSPPARVAGHDSAPPPRSNPLRTAKDQAVMAPLSPATSDPSSTPALDAALSSLTHLSLLRQLDSVPAITPPPPPTRIESLNAPDYPHSLPRVICGGRVVRRSEAFDPQQPRGGGGP